MYKHVITALAVAVTGVTLAAGPAAADEAALPCVAGYAWQPAQSPSVFDVVSADRILQGLFGAVNEDGVVVDDWESAASLPDEDEAEAFAQGLLSESYVNNPFPYQQRPQRPSLASAVGANTLLWGLFGTGTAVCVSNTTYFTTTTTPYRSVYEPVRTSRPYRSLYEPIRTSTPYTSVYEPVRTSTTPRSLYDPRGVRDLVEGILGTLRP
ncbi:hypothetical protein [Nonomuraea sp. LPB2021202275-12-8]|uniref:hypothetical protein n=1 Tax=Nonomuraea sp. LPB2021202275-12-8 TaxID=3120159 RepID=UPI00300D4909